MEFEEKTMEILVRMWERFCQIERLLEAPEIIADGRLWLRLSNERALIEEPSLIYLRLRELLEGGCCNSMPIKEEIDQLVRRAKELILRGGSDEDAVVMILPQKKSDKRFCGDLVRMYELFLGLEGYRFEPLSGFSFRARGAFDRLKYENGIHAFDEGSVTVLVLVDFAVGEYALKEADVRVDVFHSSGAGGQNVNKVASAIRLTHLPSGVAVTCQDSRSQLMNKESAFKSLAVKVGEFYRNDAKRQFEEHKKQRSKEAKERVRTYSYAKNMVFDARCGLSVPLEQVLKGGLGQIVDALGLEEIR